MLLLSIKLKLMNSKIFFCSKGKNRKRIFFLSNSNCTLNEQEMKRKKWSKPKLWSIIYRIVFCFFSFIHCLENTHRLMMLATIIMMMMMIGCDGQKKFHFFCHLKIPKNSGYHHHHDHYHNAIHLSAYLPTYQPTFLSYLKAFAFRCWWCSGTSFFFFR